MHACLLSAELSEHKFEEKQILENVKSELEKFLEIPTLESLNVILVTLAFYFV